MYFCLNTHLLYSSDNAVNTNIDSNLSLKTQISKLDTTNKKSATGAVLRSLALPGWGQYYVESYWKAPIFVAAYGTVIFFIIDNNNKYNLAADEYASYTGSDLAHKDFLYRKREYFRDYRDLNILYLAGIYLISAIDAYVGANLYGFNVDDNLAINWNLNKSGNPELTMKIKF
ncbi:MAG: DUF5683 domain-containing protein [Candidatus Kapaibacteriota bacterium]